MRRQRRSCKAQLGWPQQAQSPAHFRTNTVSSVIDTGNGGTNVYTGHQSSIYAVTTAQTGYYSVAHIERQGLGGSGLVVTATLSAANSARGACAEVSNLTSCDNGG